MSGYCARVYGLVLASNAPIDGLAAIPPQPPDLTVFLAPSSELRAPAGDDAVVIDRTDAGAWTLDYRDGTHFEIAADARAIRGEWPPESTPQDAATYLLGPVLAYALRLRGTLALHASAVAMRGAAVVIAGAPGAGKSTTATAFARRGAIVITDDVAAIDDLRVRPGYARLRLWSDVAEAMWGAAEALPLLTPTWNKRFVDVSASFASEAYAVRLIVVLGERGEDATLHELHGHEAAIALLRHASMTQALDASMRERELSQVTDLAARVRVFAGRAPDDLQRVGELCALIEAELARA